jgi:hypothetical protein
VTLRVAVADGLLGLALIGLLARSTPRRDLLAVLAGVTGACLPDLDKPGRLFFGRSPFPRRLDAVHGAVQREAAHRLPGDAAIALGAGVLVVALLRRDPR